MIIRLHPGVPKTPGHNYPGAQKEQGPKRAQINFNLFPIASRGLVPGQARPQQKRTGSTPGRIPGALLRDTGAWWGEWTCHQNTQLQVPILAPQTSQNVMCKHCLLWLRWQGRQPRHRVRAEKIMFYNVPVIISSSQAGEVVPEKCMMNKQGSVKNIFAGWHAGSHMAAGLLPPPAPHPYPH